MGKKGKRRVYIHALSLCEEMLAVCVSGSGEGACYFCAILGVCSGGNLILNSTFSGNEHAQPVKLIKQEIEPGNAGTFVVIIIHHWYPVFRDQCTHVGLCSEC